MYLQCVHVCLYAAISHAPYVFEWGAVKAWCICAVLCVWEGGGWPTDPSDGLFMPHKYDWHTHKHTERIMADVEAQLRVQQENEQSIHTSRVTCALRFGQKEVSFPLSDSLRRGGQRDNFSTALKESMSLFHLWTHWKRFARRALLWSCQLVPCRRFRLFLPRWPSNVCMIRSYVNQQYSALSLVGSSGVQTKVYCRSRPTNCF